jgi:catechol 2,3-dioxygenase-like lactoylglutathione lyase family enzyme
MKNILIAFVLITGIVSVAFYSERNKTTDPVIVSKKLAQVAIIVKDIDAARNAWAELLGVQPPEVSIDECKSFRPTLCLGKSTDAKCKLAFITLENIQIELIQPMGGKSTWQEYLDNHGEGIHHVAFQVKDIEGVEKRFELQGNPTVQLGGWDGGAYSYIDASKNLGCILELLENYN